MGYAVGKSSSGARWIGYGVPAICDHPGCGAEIDRGMGYACNGPDGDPLGDAACGNYFCGAHGADGACERCAAGAPPFSQTPDTDEWALHVTIDDSWAQWREANPSQSAAYAAQVHAAYSDDEIAARKARE